MKKLLIIALLFLNVPTILLSSEYVVVSNKNIKNITKAQVKAIFLKKMIFIEDVNLVPVNLSPKNILRIKFEKTILKTNFRRLKAYWTKQHYLGHRPPISMKSQKSAIAFIKKVDGAIIYINAKYVDEDMKIIYRWKD